MKDGIPYFPLDCELDSKFELIEAEFGLQGFAVVVKLLQRIYGGEGYYCEWTKEVALLFAKRNGTGGNAVSEIVEASIKRGIFDKDMFERYGILTSKGIQLRYLKAVDRRKQVKIKKQYLLVECAILPKNVCIIEENVNIIQKNADISQQRKEEESKVKKSKGDTICAHVPFSEFWMLYPKKQAKAAAEKAYLKIKPDRALFEKMKKALEAQKASFDWQKENGRYIPLPATWLNGKRWEDETAVETAKPKRETTYDLDDFENFDLGEYL